MPEPLLTLPQKPGTVIAIGDWWLVRLPPYETGAMSWELLPFRSDAQREHAERQGVKAQCVYGDDWVLAEAEQEGGYLVISDPRPVPSGIRYFRQELARAEPDPSTSWTRTPNASDSRPNLITRASQAFEKGGLPELQITLGKEGLPPESIDMITRLIGGGE